MTFDYDKLLADFERQRNVINQFNHRFRNHKVFQVTYEQMCNDYENVTTQMQEFLGVPVNPIKPGTGRRNNPPISDFVTNYSELKDKFADTEWASFFDA